jgi:nucleoside-diphosphate-sugar epimerase
LRLAAQRGLSVVATVRSEARRAELQGEPAEVLAIPQLTAAIGERAGPDTHVIVCFPAHEPTDAVVAPSLARAHSVTYISSTGVFGERRGRIDDTTPLPAANELSERTERLLRAEAHYRAAGATILRAAAIYGPERGLHVRMRRGEHRMPGDGSQMLSRIHVHDLAQIALAAAAVRGETFVVGDAEPAPHAEVVRFICEAYGLPWPESDPLASVHASLRADRAIDASRVRAVLGVTLRYPSYREGMAPYIASQLP